MLTHLRLHRFIPWQTLPSVLQSPGSAQAIASALCTIKIPFSSKHAVPFPGVYKQMSLRAAVTVRPTSDMTIHRAQTKRQPYIEALCIRRGCCRQHSTRLPPALRLQSTNYNIICVIVLQCLPRDGDRPAAGPCKLASSTLLQRFYSSSRSRLGKKLRSPPTTHCCWCSGKRFTRSL